LLTPVPNHLLCFRFLCCVEKVSNLRNHPVVRPRASSWNFLEPQAERLLSNKRDLGRPWTWQFLCHWQRMSVRDYQTRLDLYDEVCLICSSQPIGLKKRIHLGASSSWDPKLVISVRRTESSTVTTMCSWERRLSCSTPRELPVNISLRSRKC
jgi:hypothetical protein